MSWAPNPEKNNTLKKSTNEVKIFEAHYFLFFLAFRLVTGVRGYHGLQILKNNTLKKSTNEERIFEAQYFSLFLEIPHC